MGRSAINQNNQYDEEVQSYTNEWIEGILKPLTNTNQKSHCKLN